MDRNEKLKVPFYISTNNSHLNCLEIFISVFNNFIPDQELRILGYDHPSYTLPYNCVFISLGEQVGGVDAWSTDLRRYFSTIEDDYFIYGTEDVFFYEKPQVSFINYLSDRMVKNKKVGRINLVDAAEPFEDEKEPLISPAYNNCCLTNSPHYKVELIDKVEGGMCSKGPWELYKQTKDSLYQITTQMSLWSKEFLLEYMVDGMSPWAFEFMASEKVKDDDKYEIWMLDKDFPISKKEGYSARYMNVYNDGWMNKGSWLRFVPSYLKEKYNL